MDPRKTLTRSRDTTVSTSAPPVVVDPVLDEAGAAAGPEGAAHLGDGGRGGKCRKWRPHFVTVTRTRMEPVLCIATQ